MLAATIYQDRELHLSRSSEIHQLIHRCPDGASRIKYVIDKNDDLSFNIGFKFRAVDYWICSHCGQIVAIECDIYDPVLRPLAFDRLDLFYYPFREGHAASPDPDYIKVFCALVVFDDLRCEARQSSLHTRAVHYPGLLGQVDLVCHSSANRNKAVW